jgi:hypothetical protein
MSWLQIALMQAAKSRRMSVLASTSMALRHLPQSEFDETVAEVLISVTGLLPESQGSDRVLAAAIYDDVFHPLGRAEGEGRPMSVLATLRKHREDLQQDTSRSRTTRANHLAAVQSAIAGLEYKMHQSGVAPVDAGATANPFKEWWQAQHRRPGSMASGRLQDLISSAALAAASAAAIVWLLLTAAAAAAQIETPLLSLAGLAAILVVAASATLAAIGGAAVLVPGLDRHALALRLLDAVVVSLVVVLIAQLLAQFSGLPVLDLAAETTWSEWSGCFVAPLLLGSFVARLFARTIQPLAFDTTLLRLAIGACAGLGAIVAVLLGAAMVMRFPHDGAIASVLLSLPFVAAVAAVSVLRERRAVHFADLIGGQRPSARRVTSLGTVVALLATASIMVVARPLYVQQTEPISDLGKEFPVTIGEAAEFRIPELGVEVAALLLADSESSEQRPDMALTITQGLLAEPTGDDPEIVEFRSRNPQISACVAAYPGTPDCSAEGTAWLAWLFGVERVIGVSDSDSGYRLALARAAVPQEVVVQGSGRQQVDRAVLRLVLSEKVSLRLVDYVPLSDSLSGYHAVTAEEQALFVVREMDEDKEAGADSPEEFVEPEYIFDLTEGRDKVIPVIGPGTYLVCRAIVDDCKQTPNHKDIPPLAASLVAGPPKEDANDDPFLDAELYAE